MTGKYLIVGLGNIGREYQTTRHNVGFHVVDELARRYDIPLNKTERKSLTGNGVIKGKNVILAKPQTYMNLSGEAVRALVDYYKIDYERLFIVHDDIDLALGMLRVRKTGGHGGHNGMRNIILHLGTHDIARIRLGVGRPPGKMRAKNYVLKGFVGDDALIAQQVTETTADAVELWLTEGIDVAMSRYNGDVTQAKEEAPKLSPEEQLRLAERAHELKPQDPKPLEKMARLYKHLRRLDDAVRAHLLLAEIYDQNNNPKQVIYQWEQALRIRPELIEVREEIARLQEAQGNMRKAAQTWVALAEYLKQHGELEAAQAAVEEILRFNPQHPKALELQRAYREKKT